MPERTTKDEAQHGPLQAAAARYFGDVMHARLKPMGHRFSYRVMSLLIDLDRLASADRQSPLFGVNRAALYSFNEADHSQRDGSSLRAYAQGCAAEHGIDLAGGRVLLLCYPRLLGFTSIRCRCISATAPVANSPYSSMRCATPLAISTPMRFR